MRWAATPTCSASRRAPGSPTAPPPPACRCASWSATRRPWVGLRRQGRAPRDYVGDLDRAERRGRGGKMIDYFMVKMIGGPFFVPVMLRLMGARTGRVAGGRADDPLRRPRDGRRLRGARSTSSTTITVPTLVLWGGKAAEMDAGNGRSPRRSRDAEHRILAGQTHNVTPAALAPVLAGVLRRVGCRHARALPAVPVGTPVWADVAASRSSKLDVRSTAPSWVTATTSPCSTTTRLRVRRTAIGGSQPKVDEVAEPGRCTSRWRHRRRP